MPWSRNTLPRFVLISLLLLVVSVAATALAAASDDAKITPRLRAAFDDSDFPWRAADGRIAVWVFFTDKGLAGNELQQALSRAEGGLTERTAWRRAKMHKAGERLVDTGDLPVNPRYLAQIEATGAKPRRTSRWLNAATFEVDADQLARIAALPAVRKLDVMARFTRPTLPTPAEPEQTDAKSADKWSLDYGGNLAAMEQANVPPVHELGINGQGVIVGMLDGGFHPTHEAVAGLPVLATYDFVNDDENVDNETGDPSDSNDHGTKTMSTVGGYAPGHLIAPAFGVSMVLAKTEDVSQEVPIEEDQWVAGLEWVETYGVDIVSSSLGYIDWYTFADLDGNTAVTTIAADLAVGRGIVVVNSAGNERGDFNHIIAPADGDSVIAVGAVTSSGDYAYFSSPGPSYDGRIKPDVSALGSGNTVADPDGGYTTASGTSFSCPLTAGVAALVLSRAPSLTPMQVRDALRETADRAANPDNDYGWGIIDAYAAVTYFGPSFAHTPHGDTEATGTPITITADVTDRIAVDTGAVALYYRTDSGAWNQVAMSLQTGDTFSADIPGQPAGTTVDYYLEAGDTIGVVTTLPSQAPDSFFSFVVGPDATLPVLTHTPLRDQAYILWPTTVSCTATDNLGIDHVEMTYQLNGGPVEGPFTLTQGGDTYTLVFPLTPAEVAIGDEITYTLTAVDGAQTPNSVSNGPNVFQIIDTLGVVLVLDDGTAKDTDVKFNASKEQLAPQTGKSSATTMAGWLVDAGYVADVLPATGVTVADFAGYQAVVLSAGDNTGPVADAATRTALQDWAAAGGKLLIEGGEVGYDALSSPGYADFAAQVLHGVDWDSDNAGNLQISGDHASHPLLNIPNVIPSSLSLAYVGYGDEDAVEPAPDAYRVVAPASYTDDGGIIVYDDNPAPQSAQILYFAFNVEALDATAGRQLTENALAYLLAQESPPTSSLGGRVTLAGQSDHSGILVDAGGNTTLTAADGTWSLTGLYGGAYTLLMSKDGYATAAHDLVLGDGEALTDLNFQLQPVAETAYAVSPGLAIPDNDPTGITSIITVPVAEAGQIAGVTVDLDITHTWRGDLLVTLTSPGGTTVTLHNRSGSSADDILGNYPTTLTVEGPGDLTDFLGEDNGGDWTLTVSDNVGSDTGTLNAWGLNFTLPGYVSPVVDGALPQVTRLHPNVPNPFNPSTLIAFDLAKDGKTRLSIFDVRGMLVRRLLDEDLPAGPHAVRWDGRDGAGRSVSSGTYLYRLQSGDVQQERKMLLVR